MDDKLKQPMFIIFNSVYFHKAENLFTTKTLLFLYLPSFHILTRFGQLEQ